MALEKWLQDASAERHELEVCEEEDCPYCGDADAWEEWEAVRDAVREVLNLKSKVGWNEKLHKLREALSRATEVPE